MLPLKQASALLRQGKVGIIPTDTVYGLVASANSPEAVGRLYSLKDRKGKPGTLIAANVEQLVNLGVSEQELKLAQKHWPGPVSVVLPHNIQYLHQGLGDQAIRIPDDPVVRKFLEYTGPLQTTSANLPGEPPAATIVQAHKYFGNSIDFYVDGGDLSERNPSKIIKILTDGSLEVLR